MEKKIFRKLVCILRQICYNLVIENVDVAAAVFREGLGSVVRQNSVNSNDCILLDQNFILHNISQEIRYWTSLHCMNKNIDGSLD